MQPKAVARTQARSISTPTSTALRAAMVALMALTLIVLQTLAAQAKPESLAPLAEKISPSVVNITTSTLVEGRTGPQGIVPEGSPLKIFSANFKTAIVAIMMPPHRADLRHWDQGL